VRAPLIVVLGLWGSATATAAPRLSGRVRMLLRDELPARALATGRGDDRARLTVRVPGGAAALRRRGIAASPLVGDLAEVRAGSADEVRQIVASEGVISVEERRLLRVELDASAAAVGAPAARIESGFDGSGVLVGVVDTGADFRHADLRWADGKTKIAALLDLDSTAPNLHADLGDYGGAPLWIGDDIDAVLADEAAGRAPSLRLNERDDNGHGTHVCAIAASTGLASGHGLPAGRYVGMAPGASLIVANATHGGGLFTDADVLTAARFVVERATALGRPLVINLSVGGSGGGHDGSSHFEQGLDDLVGFDSPGRALVVAAGNDGARDQHGGGWSLDGEALLPLELAGSVPSGGVTLEVWYTGALAITVETPRGTLHGPVDVGRSYDGRIGPEGHVLVDNTGGPSPPTDDARRSATVVLMPTSAPVAAGTWRLRLAGRAARWDAWMIEGPGSARFTDHVDVDDRLALPASAHNAIVVGSMVTKSHWTNVDGDDVTRPLTVGAPSTFSSTGPTADGRFAPDVIAPGEFIAAALSADASPDMPGSAFYVGGTAPHFAWADDGVHGLLRGTSQAAPHVAGAIALLLQADPSLTPRRLREILRATAAPPDDTGFSPRLGFGRLDVLAAVRHIGGRRGDSVSAARSSVGVSRDALPPGDAITTVTATPRDADGTPLGAGRTVEITASAGAPLGDTVDAGEGRYERAFVAHAPEGAVARVSVRVDGVELAAHPSVFFVRDRSRIGRPFVAEGGCAAAGADGRRAAGRLALGGIALLALGALAARRKSRRPGRGPTLRG
jgi:subtilisin family serine protease